MKKHITLALTLILTLFFTGCKKYEEGPLISFRSAETRIHGKWEIKEFTINGADSLELLSSYYGNEIRFLVAEIDGMSVNRIDHFKLADWYFSNNKKTINIYFYEFYYSSFISSQCI